MLHALFYFILIKKLSELKLFFWYHTQQDYSDNDQTYSNLGMIIRQPHFSDDESGKNSCIIFG